MNLRQTTDAPIAGVDAPSTQPGLSGRPSSVSNILRSKLGKVLALASLTALISCGGKVIVENSEDNEIVDSGMPNFQDPQDPPDASDTPVDPDECILCDGKGCKNDVGDVKGGCNEECHCPYDSSDEGCYPGYGKGLEDICHCTYDPATNYEEFVECHRLYKSTIEFCMCDECDPSDGKGCVDGYMCSTDGQGTFLATCECMTNVETETKTCTIQ